MAIILAFAHSNKPIHNIVTEEDILHFLPQGILERAFVHHPVGKDIELQFLFGTYRHGLTSFQKELCVLEIFNKVNIHRTNAWHNVGV